MLSRVLLILSTIGVALLLPALAQQTQTKAKPQSERQKKRNEARLKKELETPFKRWLNEDVFWIISDEERTAFNRLETDDERQSFIDSFWLRRDPTPDTEENEFREEHYRRMQWANDRFASGWPGWKTDRGMIYVKFGAPDDKDEHPTGGPGIRDIEEGGGQTTFFPYERWRYRYLDGVGQDITLEFVDKSMTNEYRLTWDPTEKDALLRVPGAGLTLYEQMGLANKADRFNNTAGFPNMGMGPLSGTARMNIFDRLQQFSNVQKAPPVKFKDLEAVVTSTIRYNILPFQVRVDYFPVTNASVNTSLTVVFDRSDLQYKQKDGIAEAAVEFSARIQTQTRKPVGRPMEELLQVTVPAEQLGAVLSGQSVYNTIRPLQPGKYKLSIVAKDMVSQNIGTYDIALDVPIFDEQELTASSLVLADLLEKVATRSIGQGQFVIGSSKVRPRLNETFKQSETLGIYMQIFNFEPNEDTNKPEGKIAYEIVRTSTGDKVLEFEEDLAALSGAAAQMVIEKRLKLDAMPPGEYTLKIHVTDSVREESLTRTAKFKVTQATDTAQAALAK